MGDVASGLFALGGALVGGFASWAGTVTDSMHRRAESARDRDDKLRDSRRVLYSAFVERSDVVIDAARDVVSHDEPDDVSGESEEKYLDAWGQFVQARASVEIVGPAAVAAAATSAYNCVADVCNQVDAWYYGDEPVWSDADDLHRRELLDLRIASRAEFVATAQTIVDSSAGG